MPETKLVARRYFDWQQHRSYALSVNEQWNLPSFAVQQQVSVTCLSVLVQTIFEAANPAGRISSAAHILRIACFIPRI